MSLLPKSDAIEIREVWEDNLDEEFALIRNVVDEFPFIAMDTEFPGIVLRPVGNFKNNNDYHYQTLKDNVDLLKLIQLGLSFKQNSGQKGNKMVLFSKFFWQESICFINLEWTKTNK